MSPIMKTEIPPQIDDIVSARANQSRVGNFKFNYSTKYSSEEKILVNKRIGQYDGDNGIPEVAKAEIDRLGEFLDLEARIIATADRIMEGSVKSEIRYNYSIAQISAASVHAACKKHEVARRATEIYGGSSLSKNQYVPGRAHLALKGNKQVTSFGSIIYSPSMDQASGLLRCYRKLVLSDSISVSNRIYSPIDFLERYVEALKIDGTFVEAALTCISQYHSVLDGKPPSTSAAASLWYTIDKLGSDVELTDICLLSGHNIGDISGYKQEIEGEH